MSLEEENLSLKRENERLKKESRLEREMIYLKQDNERLRREIRSLERRLNICKANIVIVIIAILFAFIRLAN